MSEIAVLSLEDLRAKPRPSWLVRQILTIKGLFVLYAPSGAGKTFVALDLACRIALGLPWFARRARKGRVVYVAAEGALLLRLEAYMKHHGLAASDLDHLALVEQGINLLDDPEDGGDLEALIDAISNAAIDREWKGVDLVVIDTLNRAMPGGDENGSQDMGRMVDAAKAIENAFSCAVLYVHHTGKDEAKGSRGHSSLKAATDAEISIKGNGTGPRIVHAEKVRDAESGIDLGAFTLERVDLGATSDHDPEAEPDDRDWSCVVLPCALPESRGDRLKGVDRLAFSYLHRCLDTTAAIPPAEVRQRAGKHRPKPGQTGCPVEVWRHYAIDAGGLSGSDKPGTHRTAFNRARRSLENAGFITVFGDWVWLRDKRDKGGTT